MGRVAGVDLGDRRIGFALSDPDAFLASACEVVTIQQPNEAVKAIIEFCTRRGVERLVIGLPLNMDGSSGPAAERARTVAATLRERTGLRVDLWDERLTTKAAHAVLLEADTSRAKRKQLVDKVAAQLMLQGYLDAQPPA